jgi:hypothetical protein
MTDTAGPKTAIVAGRVIGILTPTDGQFETLARMARTLTRGDDDNRAEFWGKQIDRLGTLMESLIAEGDRDTVDQLFLRGKLDHLTLLQAIFGALKPVEEVKPAKAVKAARASVRRK